VVTLASEGLAFRTEQKMEREKTDAKAQETMLYFSQLMPKEELVTVHPLFQVAEMKEVVAESLPVESDRGNG
jgi:hypothetical protein